VSQPISIVSELPNGTYTYRIKAEAGYLSSGNPTKLLVLGGPVWVPVTFGLRACSPATRPAAVGGGPYLLATPIASDRSRLPMHLDRS